MYQLRSNDRLITGFPDGTVCFYGQGAFDKYCVKQTMLPDYSVYIPKDVDYLQDFKNLYNKYPGMDLYKKQFQIIYTAAESGEPDDGILQYIKNQAKKITNESDAILFEKTMTLLYVTMIAEENKANKKLGKRIKHLAVFHTLFLGMPVAETGTRWKKIPWTEIDKECKALGI